MLQKFRKEEYVLPLEYKKSRAIRNHTTSDDIHFG